jgi:hypothetical protein
MNIEDLQKLINLFNLAVAGNYHLVPHVTKEDRQTHTETLDYFRLLIEEEQKKDGFNITVVEVNQGKE